MTKFLSLTNSISVRKDINFFKIPILLYTCKPLMPKNHLKRIKVVGKYIFTCLTSQRYEEELPINGDIAIRIGEKNFKVIRLKEKVIFTIYSNTKANNKKALQILKSKNLSKLYEGILNIDRKKGVIKGVFYDGHHPNILIRNKATDEMIKELFISLLISSTIKELDFKEYVDSLVVNCKKVLRRNAYKIEEQESKFVSGVIEELSQRIINALPLDKIKLTLSHGDLKQDNLIELKNELIPIDWEFCDFRSPAYDIYKFKSRFPQYGKEFYEKLFLKIERVSKEYGLEEYFQHSEKGYIYLFLLEDIYLRLNQFESRSFAREFSNHLIKAIKRYENELKRVNL
ncbi:hypothetical protein M3172_16010 [Mesobacillus subterraneus]|uniref:hypothetical protein n=1 Tax=Mesobacillus subterraneus TaxID=285983 RepID=UPI00204111DB|nr:hypothetical protein [Mesobacillus subterraneus]MCM3574702.1 hypothetical protein [Mesobacillus subterraneus]